MNPKELIQQIGTMTARIHEQVVLFLEPEFIHSPGCAGNVSLNRTFENNLSFRTVSRRCGVCEAKDSYDENYLDFTRNGW